MRFPNLFCFVNSWFASHPNSVCMTYFEHLQFSGGLASTLLIGAIKAIVHAIFPNMYITSTTELVNELEKKLADAGCK